MPLAQVCPWFWPAARKAQFEVPAIGGAWSLSCPARVWAQVVAQLWRQDLVMSRHVLALNHFCHHDVNSNLDGAPTAEGATCCLCVLMAVPASPMSGCSCPLGDESLSGLASISHSGEQPEPSVLTEADSVFWRCRGSSILS